VESGELNQKGEFIMTVKDYRELIAWQKAMDLVEHVYSLTKLFPREELYGLTSQIRRAAVSIPSNIAEGQTRRTTKDFRHFLSISYGSL
jgi:four helix bundle protein